MRRKHQKPEKFQRIAGERIGILFGQAEEMFSEDKSLSNRYVRLARKIAMRYKVKISNKLKRRFCKSCHKFLVPGANLRIRSHKGRTIYCCLECRNIMRFRNKINKKEIV